MRIIYTLCLLVGVPASMIVFIIAATHFEDFMQRKFGKPPLVVCIIAVAPVVFFCVKAAWDQAGRWVK